MNTWEYIVKYISLIILISCVYLLGLLSYILFKYVGRLINRSKKFVPSHKATKHHQNPILSPDPVSDWEQIGTFNPAAYLDSDLNIHLLYRAIGNDGVSRIGYATTGDGFTIDDRNPYAIFTMQKPMRSKGKYDPVMYPSGGSWGGIEDPRIVEIGDRLYLTFNTFDGWDYIRIGVSSISKADFLAKRWNWSKIMLLSPAGEINKNWVLFPEKINGKFAIIHNLNPKLEISYVDRLESLASGSVQIRGAAGKRVAQESWDTWVRGAGPPPIKTKAGWLVFYHAISKDLPDHYQLGALLLDLNNPEKIIARSPSAVLTPERWYEHDWKPGVVYACGAVIKDNVLLIYYGGGDKHVCVAHTNVDQFISWMLQYGKV